MKANEVIQLRLANQRLTSDRFTDPAYVVSHFGAIQAQDYAMAKWAIALRMPNPTDSGIERSLNEGAIIRTHILRPSWHFVCVDDIRWMMELSAPYVKKATQYVDKQVGLTGDIYKKAWRIIEKEFEHEESLTKELLLKAFADKKMTVNSLMATQILIRAELEMRLRNGVRKNNRITYSIFDSKVPPSPKLSKKDSLVKLASIYFKSRGPATLKDFAWWSGLSIVDSKFAVSALAESLECFSLDKVNYYYFENGDYSKRKVSALLPVYDEFMVGYSESRDIAFPSGIDKSSFGNGIFKPIVLVDNKIVGTWAKRNKEPLVDIQFLFDGSKYRGISSQVKMFESFSHQ